MDFKDKKVLVFGSGISGIASDTMNFGITGGAISENCKLGTITVYIAPNDGRQLYLHGN